LRRYILALRERITMQFGFLKSGLQELKLRGNTIGDRGVVMLAAVLEQDRMIRVLDLARTGFGEVGALALSAALENMAGRCSLTL
jgi:Ran GTPase-activating protein (RanGAP) involved in mRNA processing and transport